MKYTTKELMSMKQEEINSICGGRCGTDRCLFKKSLRQYRVDWFCLKDTIPLAKSNIAYLESEIDNAKKRIKFNKKRIKAFEKELENDK